MRKTAFFLVLYILLAWTVPLYAQPAITGKSAILIDSASGQLLYEKNKDDKLPPASTTKILTALIAIESGRLDELVTVGPNPPRVEGTKVYLEEGEQLILRDLVLAAMIHSANDAASAIAEHLAGSQEEFVRQMNSKARELGAINSNFMNPHGLSEEGHYTTASDLALIAKYAMQNETFSDIARRKILDWQGKAWQTRLININKMLWNYDGAQGVKTGYTKDAKYTIVASARRDSRSYLAVVLGSSGSSIWDDAGALLDYGFKNFQQIKLADPEETAAIVDINQNDKLRLVPSQAFSISLPVNEGNRVESRLHLQDLQGKIAQGQEVGQFLFTVDGEPVGQVGLLAANEISPAIKPLNVLLYAGASLFFLQVLWRSSRLLRRRKRRGLNVYGRTKYKVEFIDHSSR